MRGLCQAATRRYRTFVRAGKRLIEHCAEIDAGALGNVEPLRVHNMPAMLHPDGGRVLLEQAHPFEGPTHPLSNTLLASNVDQQMFDRVLDLRQVAAEAASGDGAAGADDAALLREAVVDCLMVTTHRVHRAAIYACT